MDISIQAETGQALKGLDLLMRKVSDLRPAFRVIDKHVTSLFRRQFLTEGLMYGAGMRSGAVVGWAPLADATKRARSRRGRGRGGILRDTNRLWASMIKSGGPESIRVMEPDHYERGTAVPYAYYHQEGTGKMEARALVPDPVPPPIEAVWEKIMGQFLETGKAVEI